MLREHRRPPFFVDQEHVIRLAPGALHARSACRHPRRGEPAGGGPLAEKPPDVGRRDVPLDEIAIDNRLWQDAAAAGTCWRALTTSRSSTRRFRAEKPLLARWSTHSPQQPQWGDMYTITSCARGCFTCRITATAVAETTMVKAIPGQRNPDALLLIRVFDNCAVSLTSCRLPIEPLFEDAYFLLLLRDDFLRQLAQLRILPVLQLNPRHIDSGLVMRNHVGRKVAVGVAAEAHMLLLVVHFLHRALVGRRRGCARSSRAVRLWSGVLHAGHGAVHLRPAALGRLIFCSSRRGGKNDGNKHRQRSPQAA